MRLTASKVGLAKACGYWLDPAVELPPHAPSEASIEGDRVHKLVEEDDGDPFAIVDPAVATARKYIARHIGNRPMDKEAAYGWTGSVSDFLGHGRDAYAARPDGELVVAGTVDLVAMTGPRRWHVVDWKNGEHGSTHAAEQLVTLAALVLDATGGDTCSMHAVWLQGDGDPVDYGSISAMEADVHLEAVRALGPTEPRPGPHCSDMYCPLNGRCPAFVEAAGLVPVTALTVRRNPLVSGVKSEEDAVVAVELLALVRARLDAVQDELRSFVVNERAGRLVMPDGRTYGPATISRKGGVDGAGAYALAERLGASPEDLARLHKPSGSYERWSITGKKASEETT